LHFAVVVVGIAVLGVACSGEGPEQPEGKARISVVATSNIVADWVSAVGAGRVEVSALVPVGASPHGYSPGARDVARVAEADVVFTVGLGLEAGWLEDLVMVASEGTAVVELGPIVEPLLASGVAETDVSVAEGDDREVWDPHFWMDPLRVVVVVRQIADRLAAVDPDGAETYLDNAEAYVAELEALHEWIEGRVQTLSTDERMLVTSHDTLSYFARRYGFTVVGSAIPGTSTDREAMPRDLADLIEVVRELDVMAVFAETVESGRLIEQLARETGVTVVAGLFTGSLGSPGSGAENYIDMMRRDVGLIVDALGGAGRVR
jgi:ABC-type Zn uptake system ZnuABC Zn-binding protein ZnuA